MFDPKRAGEKHRKTMHLSFLRDPKKDGHWKDAVPCKLFVLFTNSKFLKPLENLVSLHPMVGASHQVEKERGAEAAEGLSEAWLKLSMSSPKTGGIRPS